ncbi:MAG TPA: hypothetical protein VFJ58_27370 [Armatimonadota bacterium]|nr:hypothetical protein [Armatimonadota bacterium]
MNKDEAVKELVRWHLQVDPKTQMIYRFVTENEEQPEEPIKLLEIKDAALETGRVDAFGFGPAEDFPYGSVVAQVTPSELERIKKGEMRLPEGWNLKTAEVFLNSDNGRARPR